MNDAAGKQDVNPFSSRCVRPGAIDFLFADDQSAAQVVDRFIASGRRGQIVGPHGSGKSTLLETLNAEFRRRGLPVANMALHDGQRRLPAFPTPTRQTIVVVDGYEQLGFFARLGLKRLVRRCDAGLLVSTHRSVGLPTLFEMRPSPETAQRLTAHLLAAVDRPNVVAPEEVRALYDAEQGNLRELFFRLYDLYESRRS